MLMTTARRVGRSLLVIFLVTVLAQLLLSLAPGSVAERILGEEATPESVAALNTELGLDQPIWKQYTDWLGGALQGDFGNSLMTGQSVSDAIFERLPVSLELSILGMGIAIVVAVSFAVMGASRPDSMLDKFLNSITSVFLSTPGFIAGPVLIYIFAVELGWFPVIGWNPMDQGLGMNLQTALLPALAIALQEIASLHRLLRADLLTTLGEDYIAAARAKGLSGTYVMFRHALRPSSFSLMTVLGINMGRLLGGTVIVESLFALPGVGQLLVSSISSRDVIMVQGVVTFIAIIYVVMNMLVDVSYGVIDPRIRKVVAA